eukprot:scaffold3929_cov291-Pinguiococcus_pyrenoidosus.AAC.12
MPRMLHTSRILKLMSGEQNLESDHTLCKAVVGDPSTSASSSSPLASCSTASLSSLMLSVALGRLWMSWRRKHILSKKSTPSRDRSALRKSSLMPNEDILRHPAEVWEVLIGSPKLQDVEHPAALPARAHRCGARAPTPDLLVDHVPTVAEARRRACRGAADAEELAVFPVEIRIVLSQHRAKAWGSSAAVRNPNLNLLLVFVSPAHLFRLYLHGDGRAPLGLPLLFAARHEGEDLALPRVGRHQPFVGHLLDARVGAVQDGLLGYLGLPRHHLAAKDLRQMGEVPRSGTQGAGDVQGPGPLTLSAQVEPREAPVELLDEGVTEGAHGRRLHAFPDRRLRQLPEPEVPEHDGRLRHGKVLALAAHDEAVHWVNQLHQA